MRIRHFSGRKAATSVHVLYFVIKVIFLVVAGLLIFFLIKGYINTSVDSFPVESELFAQRLLGSRSGISLQEPDTGRVIPGEIDYDRITSPGFSRELEEGLLSPNPISARIRIIPSSDFKEHVLYYHETDFLRAEVIFKSSANRGAGGMNYRSMTLPVNIYSSSKESRVRGIAIIEIAQPKSLPNIQ